MSSSHRDLVAWQRAMTLVQSIYAATRTFPREEIYGLVAQMRSAAVSIPSNIAEGHGRNGKLEFAHFLSIARGSLRELETQIEIALRLNFLDATQHAQLSHDTDALGRVLTGLINSPRLRTARTP